ncbi:hypothetical protein J4462_01665 [Candidatus Pacearchaeota archaeon]|nr:hypothetical protein [Candidatus Pacearchaeota archaeon]
MEKNGSYLDNRIIEHLEKSVKHNELTQDKTAKISDEELIKIRKDKLISFLKQKYNWVSYVLLAIIVFLAVRIRTSNLSGLKDITTGTWTLGPDLDPFLFLRWANYIVENGTLFAIDMMRYVPLGYDVGGEFLLHPYMMAWFHKYLGWTFGSESVTHSAVLYPVFMFALTIIAFFLMTRKMLISSVGEKNSNIIALVASFFLSVMPPLLPRTIAGIPEKESAAFLFLFLALYFFVATWKSEHRHGKYLNAVFAGAATAGMAHIWGGYVFIFYTLTPAVFFAFLLGQMNKEKTILYFTWLLSAFVLMIVSFERHSLKGLLSSTASGSSAAVLFIVIIHFALFNTKIKSYLKLEKLAKIPPQVISAVISVIALSVITTLFFGTSFIPDQINNILDTLIKPATSRLIQTVAENRQPFFAEWAGSFGPNFRGTLLTFWLFFVGSIYLFKNSIKVLRKKEIFYITLSYVILLVSVIFSRYSSNSTLNGENFVSKFIYAFGFVLFIVALGFYYYRYYKNGEMEKLKQINFGFLLLFSLFFLGIVGARAAVRGIMVLVPAASIIVAYFSVMAFSKAIKVKDPTKKVLSIGLAGIILLATMFSGYGFYKSVSAQAPSHVPSVYTQQWQKAMSWVRDNTPENSVFGHWWDYGYWLQSIGERATVLDGGNAIAYWNHLMGRYALTGTSNEEALEFLYAHNTTHFLIDSSDIGKYGAFSSIGSDVNYDRASYIPAFQKSEQGFQETKNSTIQIYQGGAGLDEDIIYENNESRIFLPAGQAGIGAILVERRNENAELLQPRAIFVYQGQQYTLPLRYAHDGNKFYDFESGIESGFFLMPRVVGQGQIDPDGTMLYLSSRTVKSQLARLYLYEEDNPNFKQVHSEDDFIITQIKAQNPSFNSDFVEYGGLRGPIRIWEINYPEDIEVNEEYLSKEYPEEILYAK